MASEERLSQMKEKYSVGGAAPMVNTTSPVRFELMAVDDSGFRSAMNGFFVDQKSVRGLLDDFLKGIVEQRFKDFNIDASIQQMVGRRVEVAIKTVEDRLQHQLTLLATDMARKKLQELVAGLKISISVKVE